MNASRLIVGVGMWMAVMLVGPVSHAQGPCGGKGGEVCGGAAPDAKTAKLDDVQKQELVDLYEEERVAYELYHAFGKKWGTRPFLNIQESELQHRKAVKALLDSHQVEAPKKTKAGVFPNKNLQKIYSKLLKKGSKSEVGALRAGALVEETDINDLEEAAASTPSPQIKATCEQLIRASENHLRAFVRNLEARDVEYKPRVLDKKRYDGIVSAEQGGPGRGARGPGWGRQGGRGQGQGWRGGRG